MNFNKRLKLTTLFFFSFFNTSFVVLKIWPNFSKILAKVVELAQNKPKTNNKLIQIFICPPKTKQKQN